MPEISILRMRFHVGKLSAMFLLKLNLEAVTDSMRAKGPRIIDLDLLLMDDLVLDADELTLPHPAMAERRFVLEPLAEIAPAMADPVSRRTVAEMLARLGVAGR